MKPKIFELFEDENFGVDALEYETGIMLYDSLPVDFLMMRNESGWDVYLNLYDDEPPYRNILVKGSARNLEDAKSIATQKLDEECRKLAH